jgi:tetratricopeptide (TPR) repeat protein
MTDDLYERYKEALRVGHVAVLRGTLEEALTSYRTAAEIAPSRALPHTSLGGALLRLGRLEEALVEYAAAVARAPHDEGALLGQAEALTAAGQRGEAARVLDHVSEIEEAAGRLPEAADTLRRALELEETPERARRQRGLRRETRLSAGDQAAEQLLARALRLRDEPALRAPDAAGPAAATAQDHSAHTATGAPAAVATPAPQASPAASAAPGELVSSSAEHRESTFVPPPTLAIAGIDERDKWRLPDSTAPNDAATANAGSQAASALPEVGKGSGPRAAELALYSKEDSAADVLEIAAAIDAEQSEGGPAGPPEELEATAAQPVGPNAAAASAGGTPEGAGPIQTAPQRRETVDGTVFSTDGERGSHARTAAIGVMEGAGDTALPGPVGESQHQPTGDELLVAAEAADVAGDEKALRSLLVWTARAYAREGRFDAGLDATHRLLQRSPGDVDAHLVLVELYVARNWNSLAAEKLVLLGRLADLDDDAETRERLCAVASRAFPNDERLESLCS